MHNTCIPHMILSKQSPTQKALIIACLYTHLIDCMYVYVCMYVYICIYIYTILFCCCPFHKTVTWPFIHVHSHHVNQCLYDIWHLVNNHICNVLEATFSFCYSTRFICIIKPIWQIIHYIFIYWFTNTYWLMVISVRKKQWLIDTLYIQRLYCTHMWDQTH